jgi:curved DNA-binding protein CbpA
MRRIIGPAMPSRELLAAAAEMTEALRCRDAELEADDDLLIGPPPPAVVAEAASANEAERFEEVTRILAADTNSPYDVLGVNWKMSTDNMKKRYWKLSLLVHPDKCPHPSAQEAFVKLNNAFKDLQDPEKRGAIDEKIKKKDEMEQFEIELKAMREAAEWRRLQGISLAGDEELLAGPKEAQAPKRDEWMTTLPPERKAGVPMHSTTSFSMNGKGGRGDTSVWTDTPLDRAQKAQQSYLEAYNKTKAIAEGDDVKSKNLDASIVDKYNTSKRSVSLVQKHRDSKKEKKKQKQHEKEEWEGNHPWKPWDREKDLSAGRQKVALDPENMSQGLSSRFASGAVQRNFL